MIAKRFVLCTWGILLLLLAGCRPVEEMPRSFEGASITGATLDKEHAGTYMPFTVPIERAEDPIGVDFRGVVTSGNVRVQVTDPEGQVVWQETAASPGPFTINAVVRPAREGKYQVGLAWDGPVNVSYALQWRPGEIEIAVVSPLALLNGLGMIAVAVGFAAYAVRRKLGWGYLGLGAMAWVVTVALKFAWAIPINPAIYEGLYRLLPEGVAGVLFYLYVGALTGVFEVGIVWLVMRYTRLGRVSWERGLSFGIGFGAVEALLLGLSSFGAVLAILLVPHSLSSAAQSAARLNNVFYGLAPVVERVSIVFVHILSSVLLFYGVAKRRAGGFWMAFVYKTSVDAIAAFAQVWGVETLAKIWTMEMIVGLWGILGLWGTRWVQRHYPVQSGTERQLPGMESGNVGQ